jgi:lipopolysaccharide export system permease protein
MKTLDRYIAGIFVQNLILAVISMSMLFLVQQMFSDLYDHNNSITQILYYHFLSLPQIIVQMAPPAVLLATVLSLSGLARTQELVACYSIGFGLRRIMGLVLSIVLMVSCLILVMEDRILPPVYRFRTIYKWQVMDKRTDFFMDIKRDKIWYRSKNMIYNLQRFDSTSKTIIGMSVYTFDDDFNLIQVVSAEKAEFYAKGWKLLNGTVTVFAAGDPFPITKSFVEKEMAISETPKDFQEIEKEVDGLRFKDLHRYIARMKNAGADVKSYEVKFHSRISLSFIPIVMCFLAVPFSLGTRREGGLAKDLGLCLSITFFYWLFYSIGLSLGSNGALPPWLAAWLPSTIFVALAAALIARKQ